MDTTETYIKMCEKAAEIQSDTSVEIDEHSYVACSGHYKEISQDDDAYVDCLIFNKEDGIWLPRQDQLQRMVRLHKALDSEKSRIASLLSRFWQWYLNSTGDFTSMEQLWLAFVMFELHGKIWNDKWEVKDER